VLSPADVERLAAALRRPDDRLLIQVLAYAGLRIGEALALRRADVDLGRRLMTVRESVREEDDHLLVSPTKTNAVRTVTLADSLCAALGQWLEELPGDPKTMVFGTVTVGIAGIGSGDATAGSPLEQRGSRRRPTTSGPPAPPS
jgi:integrase